MTTERVLLVLLLAAVALGCGLVLYPFFASVLWAAILVFTTWPVFQWMRARLRLGPVLAATAMTLLTALVVLLPLALLASDGAADLDALRASVEDLVAAGLPQAPAWLAGLPSVGPSLGRLWNSWAADLGVMASFFRPYFGLIAENGLAVLLGIANGIVRFALALFIAFFFWVSGAALGLHLRAVLHRIAGARADTLIRVTGSVVRGTVYGILGTAIVQGILTAFGLWLVGVPRPVLLGALASILAVLPIGAPLVWLPAAAWLLIDGHTARGLFLLIYGVIAVSGADHTIRPYFIARGAHLPFLLTVMGVLGGVLQFGLLGIFLGPVLLGTGFSLVMEFSRSEDRPLPSAWR
jgi:predicted PurR-regulated permease PerM